MRCKASVSSADGQGFRLSFEIATDDLSPYESEQVAEKGTLVLPVQHGVKRVLGSGMKRCDKTSLHYLNLRISRQCV